MSSVMFTKGKRDKINERIAYWHICVKEESKCQKIQAVAVLLVVQDLVVKAAQVKKKQVC